MIIKLSIILLFSFFIGKGQIFSQNFTFNFNTNGQRVCLAESEVDLATPQVTIKLLDYSSNSTYSSNICKRSLYGTGADWTIIASGLAAGTNQWIDTNVVLGEVWEYQIKRQNSWTYNAQTYDATGYTIGSLLKDNSDYQGQMILLVADNVVNGLPTKYERLKRELTGEGWFVNELIVPRAANWYSGDTVVGIRNQIIDLYNNAPSNDKPKALFILGHVPMPRSGSTLVTAPDGHDQYKGARGFDGYYADIDGIYTDTATFNPGGLQIPEAINTPGDYKWDQDFFTSDLEMAFGRVDFEDIEDYTIPEIQMIENYLDKLSNYKNVLSGFDMGSKSGFYFGYDNSNDGSYRSLPSISKSANIYQNYSGAIHPQWVQNNGPFKIYMQNLNVPNISEWDTYGMDATVYSSDQSHWGYNDSPQSGATNRIRSLLASNTKCIVTLWTTSAVNVFYQSCTGDPLGFAIKEIINHNATNNNIEKPSQSWDTEDWWNRTHLAYNGDPTISLFQVAPPADLLIQDVLGNATLSWTASSDTSVLGYHIYKSDSEFGIYNKITSSPISSLSYVDISYQQNDWYMVRAIKNIESGCGYFSHPSIGSFAQGSFILSAVELSSKDNINIYPNPSRESITISSDQIIYFLQIVSIDGKVFLEYTPGNKTEVTLDISNLSAGTYQIRLRNNYGIKTKTLIIK